LVVVYHEPKDASSGAVLLVAIGSFWRDSLGTRGSEREDAALDGRVVLVVLAVGKGAFQWDHEVRHARIGA
jgi:hypothetical protein